MKHIVGFLFGIVALLMTNCKGHSTGIIADSYDSTHVDLELVTPKYAAGWQVRDSAGIA